MIRETLLAAALVAAHATTSVAADHDDDAPRRWAVITSMNISCPTIAGTKQESPHDGNATSFAVPLGSLMVEYYLPNPHFSIVGGYNAEALEWYSSDVDATMRNIALGARFYPLSTACAIQPYAALMTYTNVGTQHESHEVGITGGGQSYTRAYTVSYPRLSVAPTVGMDCYIFSSLALEFQYGFSLAIDGKTHIYTTPGGQTTAFATRSNMHRHNIQIGLKLTFPFHFTSDDGNTLVKFICTALGLYDPDDDTPKQTKKERKRANLKRVLDSY